MAQDEKRALWYIKKIPLFQDVSHDTIHRLVQCIEQHAALGHRVADPRLETARTAIAKASQIAAADQ